MVLLIWELASLLGNEGGGSFLITTPCHPLFREQTLLSSILSLTTRLFCVQLVLHLELVPGE